MLEKNFIFIVIGQIISLLGNQILRFALPLYLLGETGSALLFGLISACSFVPVILLLPIGGIIADRVNKRNIMVVLDFFTAGITLLFTILLGKADLAVLILIMLVLLYGIQGAYQPAVQASIPLLMKKDELVKGNAVINLVASLAALIGPVTGGAVYGFLGIYPILYVSMICFTLSAIMELFIKIPFKPQKTSANILKTGYLDLKESFTFIRSKQPVILKISFIIASANLFFSSLVTIGLPVIITQLLDFSEKTGNQLYGYAQGALATGSLLGGLLAGIFSKKQKLYYQYLLLIASSAMLLPMAAGFYFSLPGMVIYFIIVLCCFLMVTISSLFSIQMLSYLQLLTPEHMTAKVISCTMCICMCAQPAGQVIYGFLFKKLIDNIFLIFIAAFAVTSIIAFGSRKAFQEADIILAQKYKN